MGALWDSLVTTFEQTWGSCDVTRRALSLGSREGTTGWRAKTYGTSTIKMLIVPRGATKMIQVAGVYPRTDAVGLTNTAVIEADQALANSIYYEIETVEEMYSTPDTVEYYRCNLNKLAIWQAVPGTLTWSKTRPNDPRERTKVFTDTYIRNAQITKDDDSTQATWTCMFANPPYLLSKEFRAASSPVQGLYVVEMPNSTPKMDYDLAPYGYIEHVPIHIVTIDSTGCTGTALNWKMEAEMRYICEQNPTGSLRHFEFSRNLDHLVGSMWLYDRLFTMTYERDTS